MSVLRERQWDWWEETRTVRDLDTGLDTVVIHHPEPQLPEPQFDPTSGLRVQSWDYSWTARCPGCGADAVWQRKPTEPAARIHCTCPIPASPEA